MANKKGDAVLALSIHQPWAWLIVNGYKDVENRTWALPKTFTVPQRIYVHAGKSQSDMSKDSIARIILSILTYPADTDFMLAWTTPVLPSDFGAIVGEVTITDCVRESDSPWFTGDYGFTLADPVAYDEPIPYPGSLGFFRVDLEGRTVNAGRR